MSPHDIKQLLKLSPRPALEFWLSDGSTFTIAPEDYAYVAAATLVLGRDPDEFGLPSTTVYTDTQHVVRIQVRRSEDTEPWSAPRNS